MIKLLLCGYHHYYCHYRPTGTSYTLTGTHDIDQGLKCTCAYIYMFSLL